MIQLLIYQPLYNILTIFLNIFQGELGWAILVLAALIRLIIWPWHQKAMDSQKKISQLQPKVKEIQNKYKQDPVKANQEVMKIFQEENVSLGGAYLFLIAQLFIFLILFAFFNQAINSDWSSFLYPFIKLNTEINYLFLGLIDLKMPSLILAIISASLNSTLAFSQSSVGQNKTMMLLLPFIILLFYKKFSAIVILYWIGFSLVNISQEFFIKFRKKQEIVINNNKT